MLCADFDAAIDWSLQDRLDSATQAFSKLDAKLDQLSGRIDEVKHSIGVDLDELCSGLQRAAPQVDMSNGVQASSPPAPGSGVSSSEGLRSDGENRAPSGHRLYVPPPARGMQLEQIQGRTPFSSIKNLRQSTDVFGLGPRIELPRFDGSNPKLWQSRCEDYFKLWNTPSSLWISYASSLFEGAAARWLESVHRRVPQVSWEEFCRLLQSRFGRNLHQAILRKFFSINQTGSVEEYVERFSDLYDQFTAYENYPNTVHYVTRFMEGLKPSVRVAVGLQQPLDLDAGYQLAILHEELGAGSSTSSSISSRLSTALPLPLPPVSAPAGRIVEGRPVADSVRKTIGDDKWGALRAYRKAKGLWFVCGERWGKDHRYKQEVQLHVVQEMVEILQENSSSDSDNTEDHAVQGSATRS